MSTNYEPSSEQCLDFAALSSQMAAQHRSAEQFDETLQARVDRLVEATAAEDWKEVRRLGDYLARTAAACGYTTISQRAAAMRRTLDEPTSSGDVRRSILQLIGACGRARRVAA